MVSKYPIVEVEWDDASSEISDGVSKKYVSTITYTVGYLVYEGSEGVVLFTDIVPKGPAKGMRCKHCIPNGMVKKINRL
jgi:hypothetical protein